ncbi:MULTISPECIES: hypothetical protein [Halorubrum]|uniref:Gins51 C-terminal domain-containing protein n=1 Tax=Halorubrum hochstenium ATCC 700873 TaxID=1227481 RepID=M0F762_9EURY|nr:MULTISPECIES: hypothetical protein [Halorubrum]ELZ55042.1 hypothetical protein C467_09961 [Halorubrum hochstenium ATCC 700873]
MNLDELRSAQAKERRKDSLQHLRDSFYDDVGAYVADLRAARDRRAEQVENPFEDDDVRRLSDEVETAEEVAEALYERRVGKVVKLASFAAADMSVDEEGMTTEERRLFDDLVERITANKSEVLDVLAGESPVGDEPTTPDDSPAGDGSPAPDESPVAGEPAGTERAPETNGTPSTGDPEPAGAEPVDAERPGSPSPDADAGALAGAMGGDDADPATDGSPEPTAHDAAPPAGSDGDGDGTTPVPPDPAPPGAVGVDGEADGTERADRTEGLADADPTEDTAGETGPGATTDGGAVPDARAGGEPDAETGPGGSDAETGPGGSDAETDPAESTDRATVRITRDVGAIFGVDEREYELASEDVVSLPLENADPLVQRDAAERVD